MSGIDANRLFRTVTLCFWKTDMTFLSHSNDQTPSLLLWLKKLFAKLSFGLSPKALRHYYFLLSFNSQRGIACFNSVPRGPEELLALFVHSSKPYHSTVRSKHNSWLDWAAIFPVPPSFTHFSSLSSQRNKGFNLLHNKLFFKSKVKVLPKNRYILLKMAN